MNPVITALGNVVPQAAAQAKSGGNVHAWRASSVYISMIMFPVALYSISILIMPEAFLRFFYGSDSEYLDLSAAVRLLTIAGLAGAVGEVVISFLHGVTAVPSALAINAVGTLTTMALAVPLIAASGLTGGCLALIAGSVFRLAAAHYVMAKLLAQTGGRPA